ncbi:hypothetical protein BJX61DRAFT_180761 [Aspergillus egyptiacus]|nr:hypothetical protein BJX61DRAFT_180761 [Aspergillus egyptiacus]
MPQFGWILASLWLLSQLVSALPASPELFRVPRHVWDTSTVRRDEDASSITPVDHEEFVWASTDEPNKKAVVVSMVAYAKQDERILDMDKFSFALESASCNADDMSFEFKHKLIYLAAKTAWQWVNYNDMRSFVLVPSWEGCGEDKSHDPWVVSQVQFDDKTQKVVLTSTKSTWKKVMNTFILDFGEVVLGGQNTKRDIIPDLDEKFTLDVGATLPSKIFEWKIREGVLNGTLTANCDDCGTSGQLVFAGHIEASLGWTGVDIDKFEISVTPQDLQAHVGLSLEFLGEIDFRGLVSPSEEITLLEIPVSGWNIPRIFEFGPRIQLNAGYVLDYIGGEASVSTGITASIPNTAIAKLDLLSEDSVQISGWVPEIETDPLEIIAQIDAQARIYTEIALSVSLTVLDDNGFGVDLAFKLPEVTVRAAGGYDSNGFCENNQNPWGVALDASVGADLSIEGWKEVDGDRDTLFGVTLFETDDLYEFPQLCLSFDDVSVGYCPGEVEDDEEDDDDDDEDEEDALNKRSDGILPHKMPLIPSKTTDDLVPRQEPTGPNPVGSPLYAACGTGRSSPIRTLEYPRPTAVRLDTGIPAIQPKATCAPRESACPPEATGLDVIKGPVEDRAFLPAADDPPGERAKWNTEHIYEGVWIKYFMEHLQTKTNFQPEGNQCHTNLLQFWEKKPGADFQQPEGAEFPETWERALMQQLGTILNYRERMVLLPGRHNNYKGRMFRKVEIHRALIRPDTTNFKHGHRWCDLARVINSCKYYGLPDVQKAVIATVRGLEDVLRKMDEDNDITKPTDSTFVKEHEAFYNTLYEEGIWFGRKKIYEYAAYMAANEAGMATLPTGVRTQVENIIALGKPDDTRPAANDAWEDWCPFQPRSGWPDPE